MQEILTLQYNIIVQKHQGWNWLWLFFSLAPVAILNMRFVATFSLGFFHFIHWWIFLSCVSFVSTVCCAESSEFYATVMHIHWYLSELICVCLQAKTLVCTVIEPPCTDTPIQNPVFVSRMLLMLYELRRFYVTLEAEYGHSDTLWKYKTQSCSVLATVWKLWS